MPINIAIISFLNLMNTNFLNNIHEQGNKTVARELPKSSKSVFVIMYPFLLLYATAYYYMLVITSINI